MSRAAHRRAAALVIPLSLAVTAAAALPAAGLAPATAPTGRGAAAPAQNDVTDDAASPRAGRTQPAVQARAKKVLRVHSKTFKDLDGDGKLTPYEDWRLPAQQRAADLVGRMTLAEQAGLMLIDTLNAGCEGAPLEPSTSDYLDTQQMRRIIVRNVVESPGRTTCGPDTGFRAGSSVTPSQMATFMNTLQERAEGSRLGIPILAKSNARNHIDPQARAGINEASGAFTAFPKEAGLAAAALGRRSDMSVVEDFARVMGAEWNAVGIRGMYGYMADLSTEPRWYRVHETFTEDARLAADIVTTLVRVLQGPVGKDGVSLSPTSSVALTMKHFPGGGPQELGLDPHYAFGKAQVYPGGAFEEHLLPFKAAINAGVAAIMPYYGVPVGVTRGGTTYDTIGMAFSDQIVNDLLRGELGFAGYVNSDTGIITDRAWGLETATVPQRVAAAVNSGSDTLSGFHDATVITDLVRDGLVSAERVALAAERLVTPLFQMGLFEDPYVDAAAADSIVGSAEHKQVAAKTQRDSMVLLQNARSGRSGTHRGARHGRPVLPMRQGATVYVLGDIDTAAVRRAGYTVVDGNAAQRPSAAGADYVLVDLTAKNAGTESYRSNDPETGLHPEHINPSVLPGIKGLDGAGPYGAADACVSYGAAQCTDDGLRFGGSFPWESGILDFSGMSKSASWQVTPSLDRVQQVMKEVGDPRKVVLNVYFRQPYVLDEASGLREAGAILANFGADDEALVDVLSGASTPRGRMPFALAGTRAAIAQQRSDTPGYSETTDGDLFPYAHGLRYRGRSH